MMQTTEDSCPIICNVQISVICLSSSTYVTGLDSCQSDVAKAGVHKNVFAVLNVGLASGFTGLNRFYYISLTRKFRVKIIVESASDAEIPRPRKNRGSTYSTTTTGTLFDHTGSPMPPHPASCLPAHLPALYFVHTL